MEELTDFATWCVVKGYELDEVFSTRIEPKCVILMGGPGVGKTYIGNIFKNQGYRPVLIDNFFRGLVRQQQGGKAQVSLNDPQQQGLFQTATKMANKLMYQHMMVKGYPFITEKTGANLWTIEKTKQACDQGGYDLYGILVQSPLELALQRNRNRPDRSLKDDQELQSVHQKVYDQQNVANLAKIFGNGYFFTVTNDESPENNKQINQVAQTIMSAPIRNQKGAA